jgi:2-oxoisovalerate dehydrogenase E1 component
MAVASNLGVQTADTSRIGGQGRTTHGAGDVQTFYAGAAAVRIGSVHKSVLKVARYPERLAEQAFYTVAYPLMFLSRRLDEKLLELYRKGYVRGTVTMGIGNEATAAGMALPFWPGRDVVSLLHRDLAAHLLWGATPYRLVCQYMANADSLTDGHEGNCHHGDAAGRRLPMMSHLGKMLSLVVGGTWAARRHGEEVFGLAVIGDGGTSTGEFHEALNIASVRGAPVLFLIQNNHYSFSTPTGAQYRCRALADRAQGYGIAGRTIDGTDAFGVYTAVCDALDAMRRQPAPAILECMTLRLHGHAAYDKAEYVSPKQLQQWWSRDPLPAARRRLQEVCGLSEAETAAVEEAVEEEVQAAVAAALKVPHLKPQAHGLDVYAPSRPPAVPPFQAQKVKNGDAVRLALDYLLAGNPRAFLAGLDVGTYGSAFKTCKGLSERFGPERVIDMPLCESGILGFALGASQVGADR